MSESNSENKPEAVEKVDEQRRAAMFTMANAMAYVPPVVATFAMGGMSVREAHAYSSNFIFPGPNPT